MAILKIKDKEYTLRLEYRELKKFEAIFNGRPFTEIINMIGKNPSLTDMETLVFGAIQDKDLTREQFSDLLDDALSDPDSGLSFDKLMQSFLEAVENSVFIRAMEKQKEAAEKENLLQKQGAV